MFVLFRIKNNNEYLYGWINYSGHSWPTILYVHHTAFSKMGCLLNNTETVTIDKPQITIFPNPFENDIHVTVPDLITGKVQWRLYNDHYVQVDEGEIKELNTELQLGHLSVKKGIFLLHILVENKIIFSQILIKI